MTDVKVYTHTHLFGIKIQDLLDILVKYIYYMPHNLKIWGLKMKTKSSLKSARKRGNVQLIRRGKRVFAIDKKNPRFNARQG